ncbi:MAG: fumarylacetoacetate hydrolase family protein [Candidatus Binatia bacterium]
MRLVTFLRVGEPRLGAVANEQIIDLNAGYQYLQERANTPRARELAAAVLPPDILGFLAGGESALAAAREVVQHITGVDNAALTDKGIVYPLKTVTLKAPVPRPTKLILVGLNYRDHAEEAKMKTPEVPTLFSKYASSVIGPGEAIRVPKVSDKIDYEGEFAFVIGRRGKDIPKERAFDYVAGYTILNDVSCRDYQMKTTQWMVGKTFDTFAPMGPYLVLKDEISDPHNLDLTLRLNDQVMQHSNTRNLIFNVPDLIAYMSQVTRRRSLHRHAVRRRVRPQTASAAQTWRYRTHRNLGSWRSRKSGDGGRLRDFHLM